MSRYTLVFEWHDGQEPEINRDTSLFGGSICAVQFNDALAENERLIKRIEELKSALCEAMAWNWLDGDAQNHVSDRLESVLRGGESQ